MSASSLSGLALFLSKGLVSIDAFTRILFHQILTQPVMEAGMKPLLFFHFRVPSILSC
jgi:hypothetical protein